MKKRVYILCGIVCLAGLVAAPFVAANVQDEISYIEERSSIGIATKGLDLPLVLSNKIGSRLSEVFVFGYDEKNANQIIVRKLFPADIRRSGGGVYEEKRFDASGELEVMIQKCSVLLSRLSKSGAADSPEDAIFISDFVGTYSIGRGDHPEVINPVWEIWKELGTRF